MGSARVLYVIDGLGRGGAEKQLHLLLQHLDRRAFAPAVVSLSAGGVWAGPIRALGVPVVELARRRSVEVRRLLALYRVVRRTTPDILQTFLLYDNVYGLLAGWMAGVPALVASRRIDDYGRARPGTRVLDRLLAARADAVICNAERLRRAAAPRRAARYVVIPNGVAPAAAARPAAQVRAELGVPPAAPLVVTVGRLAEGKNQALFLDVAAEVAAARAGPVFLLVGGGPLEGRLRARAGCPGLAGRVVFAGERGDVPDLLAAADVFLLTSDREGTPNAVLEAMQAGRPCVVTDAGGTAEVVLDGETGYVCARGDRRALADRVLRLVDDAALRARLGAAGRRRVESRFSAEAMARATEALYRTLLPPGPAVAPAGPRPEAAAGGRPLVSVVIPVRDEARFLPTCLDAVLAQEYPRDRLEVIVVDGGSQDASRAIAEARARTDPRVRVVTNPAGTIPAGLNTGIRACRGDVVARADARAILPPGYVAAGVRLLAATGADNVGGPRRAAPLGFLGRVFALVLESPFGMGGAARHYRSAETRAVDTVYLGMYPRRVLDAIGLFDEELVRDQDDELNYRLRARGGRIVLSPALATGYVQLPSVVRFLRQNFLYGCWKVRVAQKHPRMMCWRHLAPPCFTALVAAAPLGAVSPRWSAAVGAVLAAYGAGAVGAALALGRRAGWRHVPALPPAFLLLHLAWGAGFLAGLVRFLPGWLARGRRGS